MSNNWPMCLGDTVEKIAATLRNYGVRGYCHNPRLCPIAASYQAITNRYAVVVVLIQWPVLCKSPVRLIDIEVDRVQLDIPEVYRLALADFAIRFDKNEFPDLKVGNEQKEEER